jgi:hypothetical protein
VDELNRLILDLIRDTAVVKENIKEIQEDLAYHIRRTELNEQSIDVLKKHMWMSTGAVGAVGVFVTLITILSRLGII